MSTEASFDISATKRWTTLIIDQGPWSIRCCLYSPGAPGVAQLAAALGRYVDGTDDDALRQSLADCAEERDDEVVEVRGD